MFLLLTQATGDFVGQHGEFRNAQCFAPDIFAKTAGGNHFSRAGFAQLREAGCQAVGKLFPTHGEACPDGAEEDGLIMDIPGLFLADMQGDYSGSHLGLGKKAMSRDIKE